MKLSDGRANQSENKMAFKKLFLKEVNNREININMQVYSSLSILYRHNIVMYLYWNDYIKPKYADMAKICYRGTGCFIAHVKYEDAYADLYGDVGKIFNTSIYDVKRQPIIGEYKKVIRLMKNEFDGRKKEEFKVLRPNMYSYLTDNVYIYKGKKPQQSV